jgi:heavy metal sensor kinase
MRLIPNSIKGRLFLWIFLSTSALLIVLGTFIYQEIKKTIFLSVAHTLRSKIQILKGLLHEKHGAIELQYAEIVSGEYSIPRSGYYYKVLVNGNVLAASSSLVKDDFNLASGKLESRNEELKESVYTSIGPANEPIMVVQHYFKIFDMPATIYAAQSLEESFILIDRFKKFFLIFIPLNIFIVALVGLWITRQSLKPLKIFSSKIERITHKTLSEKIDTEFQAREIKGLAKLFNAMLDRLQGAFNTEKRLIADASHELKTPLSVINTQCEVLLQKDRTKEEYTTTLNTIKTTSGTMKKLIDDMLSLARLDSGILSSSDFKIISINDCLEKAIKLLEPFAEKNHIKINTAFTENVNIPGDESTLTEAFLNIIKNAIRYNVAGGTVEISVSKDNSQTKVMIKDSGIGIKEGDLERIFDRFYQVDTSRSSEGTGLGLSIAKAIIEAHGGKISVESKLSKGSCFIITLPL